MQGTPPGFPRGMPGMGEEMEGATQQAPQCSRHSIRQIYPLFQFRAMFTKQAGIFWRSQTSTLQGNIALNGREMDFLPDSSWIEVGRVVFKFLLPQLYLFIVFIEKGFVVLTHIESYILVKAGNTHGNYLIGDPE